MLYTRIVRLDVTATVALFEKIFRTKQALNYAQKPNKKEKKIYKSVYFLVESRRHAQPKVRPDSSAPILTSFQIFLC